MPIQDRLEEFAMQLETLSQEKKWLDVDSVGAGIGLSPHESRHLAYLLVYEGWLNRLEVDGSLKVRLVKRRVDEIAKLPLPRWQRWFDKHPYLTAALISATFGLITGVIGTLITIFLTHLLLPPPKP